MTEKIRSFIAIELPAEVQQALAGLESRLKASGGAPVKWVKPQNIHLTLKFLGDVDSGDIDSITTALREASRGVSPFNFTVSGTGVFPDARRVRVVWVGLKGDLDKLNQLQKRIEEGLVSLGFPAEGRGFSPHLTIGRVKDYAAPDARQAVGQLISKTTFESGREIKVNSFNLMKSQLTPEGPVYSKISIIELK